MPKKMTEEPKTVTRPHADAPVNGKSSGARYASDGRFTKTYRKTSTHHAGLFRRLAGA